MASHGSEAGPGWQRREVVLGSLAAVAGVGVASAFSAEKDDGGPAPYHGSFPSRDPALVQEMVGASHGNIERVRELLALQPDLAKAAVDWGFGDWEMAIGAASHVGNRAMAELLMEHGARPDLFTMAMMGWTDAVRAVLSADPALARVRGPHGFSLAHHARMGREQAAGTLEYLQSVEGAGGPMPGEALMEDGAGPYLGRYQIAGDGAPVAEVAVGRFGMGIKIGESPTRVLRRLEGHTFQPIGSDGARVVFSVEDGLATGFVAHAPQPLASGRRLD